MASEIGFKAEQKKLLNIDQVNGIAQLDKSNHTLKKTALNA